MTWRGAATLGTLTKAAALAVAVLAAVGPAGTRDLPAVAGEARAQAGAARYGETVVVAGSDTMELAGALDEELWVWSWRGDSWQLLQSQLDERNEIGEYVAAEGDGLDENDELVFPLDPDGAVAPDGAWPPGMERRLPPQMVKVTDPLSPGFEAWAYVILSHGGPEIALPPLVTFDGESLELRSDAYVLGFADSVLDGYVGYKRLSLWGATGDLLDRMKIRISLRFGPTQQEITEEQLGVLPGIDLPGLTPNPVKAGPVRAILDSAGAAMAYQRRVELNLDGLRDLEVPAGFDLEGVRCSLDFTDLAVGAKYSDANVPGGVVVDGSADSVPGAPVPAWREMDTADGRVAVLSLPSGPTADARAYYKDDSSLDPSDTGDKRSYGDNGVGAPDVDQFANAGFPGQVVVLPATGESGLVGPTAAELAEQAAAPLAYAIVVGAMPATATAPPPSATPHTPEASETVTPPLTPVATATDTALASATPIEPSATVTATPTSTELAGQGTPSPSATPTDGATAEPTPTTGASPSIAAPTATAEPTPDPAWAHHIALPLCSK
ncbi:MAG: hypothetical protein ACK2UL_03750 [Anaerolineae bacterium]